MAFAEYSSEILTDLGKFVNSPGVKIATAIGGVLFVYAGAGIASKDVPAGAAEMIIGVAGIAHGISRY